MSESKAPGRRLEAVYLRPGFSIYLGQVSYSDTTLHQNRYPHLRMWDVGPHCLLQSVGAGGKVTDEVEVMWHAVNWRRAFKSP